MSLAPFLRALSRSEIEIPEQRGSQAEGPTHAHSAQFIQFRVRGFFRLGAPLTAFKALGPSLCKASGLNEHAHCLRTPPQPAPRRLKEPPAAPAAL